MVYRAAFSQRPDLFFQWLSDPLELTTGPTPDGFVESRSDESLSAQLVREMVEYIILEQLVILTTDYFSGEGFTQSSLKEYDREGIPDVLLRNRFLELFTRSPQVSGIPKGAELIAIVGGNIHYLRFDMKLPAKSSVRRGPDHEIVIDNPFLVLKIRPMFEGSASDLPPRFLHHFVGVDRAVGDNIYAFAVRVGVSSETKWRGILSLRGWRYQLWAEQFIERMDELLGKERFFDQLLWPTVNAILQSTDVDRRPVENSGWAYNHFLGFHDSSSGELAGGWNSLIQHVVSATQGDEQARQYVESALTEIAGRDEEGVALASVMRRILAGEKPEDLPAGLGTHPSLVVQYTLDALEAASHRQYREIQKHTLTLAVATIAAAQGDEDALRSLRAYLSSVSEEGADLVDLLPRIVAGDRGDDLLEGLDPQVGALIEDILLRLHELESRPTGWSTV